VGEGWVSVLSGSLSSLRPTFVGVFACLDFGPCPLFHFLSLAQGLSFYEVWQDFINVTIPWQGIIYALFQALLILRYSCYSSWRKGMKRKCKLRIFVLDIPKFTKRGS
jgi:hypothetical protein